MSGQEKAASPVLNAPTVRGVLVMWTSEREANDLASDLGIDPDMPVETLKRRLLWGERVEQLERQP